TGFKASTNSAIPVAKINLISSISSKFIVDFPTIVICSVDELGVVTASSLLQAYKPNDKIVAPKTPKVKFLILFILKKLCSLFLLTAVKNSLQIASCNRVLNLFHKSGIRDYRPPKQTFYCVWLFLGFT